jgi:hypothetical protein
MSAREPLLRAWNGAEVRVARLERPYRFESPFGSEEFALLLLVADPAVTSEEQEHLSAEIVATECRYAACAGHGCSSWDDSIDLACVLRDLEKGEEGPFVMTSWHEDETLDEVAEFFLLCVSIDGEDAARRLALVVGGGPEEYEALERALRVQAADESD